MESTTRDRITAAALTVLVCLLALLWLNYAKLDFEHKPAPEQKSQITIDEEFVEFDLTPATPDLGNDSPSMAQAEEPAADAMAAAESGETLEDAGEPGPSAPAVTQKQESAVQQKKKDPAAEAAAQKKKQEEAIQREASNQISSAFDKASGKHNAATGSADVANAGQKGESTSQGSISGTGTGSVGKGWALPQYARVPSPVTGSVIMSVTFDASGTVTNVTFVGGDAPAATNAAVRRACEAEVRAKRFVRTADTPAPEQSRAQITYNFK